MNLPKITTFPFIASMFNYEDMKSRLQKLHV
jgi:hypothetical protein